MAPRGQSLGRRVVVSVRAALAVWCIVTCVWVTPARTEEITHYTVQAGDTCGSIARRLYGDAAKYDIIHRLNPGLGASPHKLVVGSQLVVSAPAPDAKIAFVRNVVQVQAATTRPGELDAPLFRGNRVFTGDASAAGVLFRDASRVVLADNTLIIIYGETSARSKSDSNATLVSGNLRASLAGFAGKKPVVVDTGTSSVALGSGEAQVSVDAQKATRLAVYDGESSLRAQKRTTKVPRGFGSKAEAGRAPTPPKPLPPAPVWVAPPQELVLGEGMADLSGAYGPGTAPGPAAARWHVQVARDVAFQDVVVDAKVPVTTLHVEAKGLPAGLYVARVSAIDADEFEGAFSAQVTTRVVTARVYGEGEARRVAFEPSESFCGLDGASLTRVDNVAIAGTAPHEVRCGLSAEDASAQALTLVPAGRRVVLRDARVDASGPTGPYALAFSVTDTAGAPVSSDAVRLRGNATFGDVRRRAEPGRYVAATAWTAIDQLSVSATVDGEVSPAVSVSLPAPTPPPVPARTTHFDAGVGALVGLVGDNTSDAALGGALWFGASHQMTHRLRLALAAQGKFERVPEPTAARDARTLVSAELPLRVLFAFDEIAPYVSVAPTVVHGSGAAKVWRGGLTAALGARVGGEGFGVFVEPGYRFIVNDTLEVPASGFQFVGGLFVRR